MRTQDQEFLCGKIECALKRPDVTEVYDLAKILDSAAQGIHEPHLIARVLVVVNLLLPELDEDSLLATQQFIKRVAKRHAVPVDDFDDEEDDFDDEEDDFDDEEDDFDDEEDDLDEEEDDFDDEEDDLDEEEDDFDEEEDDEGDLGRWDDPDGDNEPWIRGSGGDDGSWDDLYGDDPSGDSGPDGDYGGDSDPYDGGDDPDYYTDKSMPRNSRRKSKSKSKSKSKGSGTNWGATFRDASKGVVTLWNALKPSDKPPAKPSSPPQTPLFPPSRGRRPNRGPGQPPRGRGYPEEESARGGRSRSPGGSSRVPVRRAPRSRGYAPPQRPEKSDNSGLLWAGIAAAGIAALVISSGKEESK